MTPTSAEAWSGTQKAELLRRHQPYLLYDALEVYFADAADEWTRNPANRLHRRDGMIIAPPKLALEYLGSTYPDGVEAHEDDYIACSDRHYDEQYAALRSSDQSLRNVIYGRAIVGSSGLWLQYWFWYFLNDYQLALGIDVHEGDWEMVQLHIAPGAQEPDEAVYAQHTYSQIKPWDEVRRHDGDAQRPRVYVARGSHASFFEPGYHETDFYDVCDGEQVPKTKPIELRDVTTPPAWMLWPGHWGSTKARYPGPGAPCAHPQWNDPESLRRIAHVVREKEPPGAPHIVVRPHDERLWLQFDTSHCDAPPHVIVVTINSRDETTTPPRAFRIPVVDFLRGTISTRIPMSRHKHYDVRVASVDHQDRPSPAEIYLFDPPNPLRAAVRRLTSGLGHVFYAMRRALHRDGHRRSDAPLA